MRRPRSSPRRPGAVRRLAWKAVLVLLLAEGVLRTTGFLLAAYYQRSTRAAADSGATRILFIGESTTFGVGSDEGEPKGPFPAQLEAMLNAAFPGRRFRCLNLGVPAATSSELLRHARKNLMEHDPHLVVIQAGHNILMPSPWRLLTGRLYDLRDEEADAVAVRLLGLLGRSRLYRTAKLAFETAFDRRDRGHPDRERDFYHFMTFEENKANVRGLIDAAREAGKPVLLCNYFQKGPRNALLAQLAEECGVPLCDNERAFEARAARGEAGPLVSRDLFHPTGAGYRLIAENLFESLTKTPALAGALGLETGT